MNLVWSLVVITQGAFSGITGQHISASFVSEQDCRVILEKEFHGRPQVKCLPNASEWSDK